MRPAEDGPCRVESGDERRRGVARERRSRPQPNPNVFEAFAYRPSHFRAFFETAHRLLADDGVMLLHTIGRIDGPGVTDPWVRRYIFPGGYSPALSEVVPVIEKQRLWITDIEVLRLHYAETLRHWRERFLANRKQALKLYDERFCRMWEFYLAGSEIAFRHMGLAVFQIQLAKRQDAVPLVRDYMVDDERAIAEAERRTDAA